MKRVIALVGGKGGAGKTTLCVNLASALLERGTTTLLDADPQRSALRWRSMAERTTALPVHDAVDDLPRALARARSRFVLIDCPPSLDLVQSRQALEAADLALIPVQPSPLDLWATAYIESELQRVRSVNPGLEALLVINQLEPRTRLSRLVRRGLDELSLAVAASAIHRRVAYRSSFLEGRTVLDQGLRGRAAADEIRQLIDEVIP